jgi:hypothetical protein
MRNKLLKLKFDSLKYAPLYKIIAVSVTTVQTSTLRAWFLRIILILSVTNHLQNPLDSTWSLCYAMNRRHVFRDSLGP